MSNLIFKHDVVDNLDSDLNDRPLSARMGKYLYKLAKKTPKRYSEEEQWTGEYWVDGKKIYQKTIHEIRSSYESKGESFIYNFSYDKIWIGHDLSFIRIANTGAPNTHPGRIIPFSYYRSSSGYYEVFSCINQFETDKLEILVEMNKNTGMLEFFCTVLYTKK